MAGRLRCRRGALLHFWWSPAFSPSSSSAIVMTEDIRMPDKEDTITSLLHEKRLFPPSEEFRKQANINTLEEYETLFKEAEEDLEVQGSRGRLRGLLGQTGRGAPRLVQEVGQGPLRRTPLLEMVRRRPDQRFLQLPRPTPRYPTPHQDGPHLGRRTRGRQQILHLRRTPPRGLQIRQRAQEPRYLQGR